MNIKDNKYKNNVLDNAMCACIYALCTRLICKCIRWDNSNIMCVYRYASQYEKKKWYHQHSNLLKISQIFNC